MKISCGIVKVLAGLGICFAVNSADALVNGGFEQTVAESDKTGFASVMKNAGWIFDEPLAFPVGWRVNSGASKNGEYRIVTGDKVYGGKNSIFLKGHLMYTTGMDVSAGDAVEVSFYSRSEEKNDSGAGVCLYYYCRDEKGRDIFTGSEQFLVSTETGWSKKTGSIVIPAESRGKKVSSFILALFSDKGAYFDDVELKHQKRGVQR